MEREYNVAEYNKKAFQLMKLILSNILREKKQNQQKKPNKPHIPSYRQFKKKKKKFDKIQLLHYCLY